MLIKSSWSALHHAAANGRLGDVRQLLATGTFKQNDKAASLRLAAQMGHDDIVAVLLPISQPSIYRHYPLQAAAAHGYKHIVARLLTIDQPKTNIHYALVAAAEQGFLSVVSILAPISSRMGCTKALVAAVLAEQSQVVEQLLPFSRPTDDDSMALRWAVELNDPYTIDLLVPHSHPGKAADRLMLDGKFQTADRLAPYLPANRVGKMLSKGVRAGESMPQCQARMDVERLTEALCDHSRQDRRKRSARL